MTDDPRTQFALAAVDFAKLFNDTFGSVNLSGYTPKLTAPESQSTGGGIQSRQHITLENPAEGKTIVVGSCDNVAKQAELRVYDHVASSFAQRFDGMVFPVGKAEYDDLHNRFKDFLEMQAIRVGLARPPIARPTAPPAQKGKSSAVLWIVIVLVVLAIAAGLVYYLVFYQQ
jgi:hypothetical protein